MGTPPELSQGRIQEDGDTDSVRSAARHTVVVVDDHPIVRIAVRSLLQSQTDLDLVGEAGSIQDARAQLVASKPDVLLLELNLPDGDGMELCREAVEQNIKVVVLTAYAGEELLVEAMRSGAAGYVLKQDRAEEIIAAIRTVGGGGAHFSGAATPQMLAVIATGGVVNDPLSHLTDRERELLALLGEGLCNRQIAERLFLGERTVKNYVSRLLRKLDMDRRAEAAVFAAKLEARREMRRYSLGSR